MIDRELSQSAKSPARAILLQSPGRKPWVSHSYTFIEPKGAALPHGKCSRRKCRSYGAQSTLVCVYPGLHFGLCPHYTLGFAGVSCLKALTSAPNNKRKSLGHKSLGFERKYRPTLKGFLVCNSVSLRPRQGLHLPPTLLSRNQYTRRSQEYYKPRLAE